MLVLFDYETPRGIARALQREERFLTSAGRRFSDRIGIFDRKSESGRKSRPAAFGMTVRKGRPKKIGLLRSVP